MTPRNGEDSPSLGWLLLGVLGVAAVLRLRGILAFPLVQDEMYTFFEARDLFGTRFEPGIEARPLYYFLQHSFSWLVPDGVLPDRHPVTLRALPFTFGLAGVWATWKLGKRVGGRWAALGASLILAVSPWHLYVTGMARYWALVYLLGCLAFWRLLVAADSERISDHMVAAALVLLGLLTHPTFAFPLAGSLLALRFVDGKGRFGFRCPTPAEWKGFWLPLTVAATTVGVLLVTTGNSDAVRNWAGRDLEAVLRLVPAMVQWATPVVVAAGLAGMCLPVVAGRDASPEARRWAGVALAGVGSGILLLLAASGVTDVYADYGISMLPLVVASGGYLVAVLVERCRGACAWIATAALVVVLGAIAPSTASHLSDGTRFDFRPAFEDIHQTDPEIPVFVKPIIQQRWYAPHLQGRPLSYEPREMEERLPDSSAWVVVGVRRYGIVGDQDGRLRRWLSEACVLHSQYERQRFDYRMYRVELHRCTPRQGRSVLQTRDNASFANASDRDARAAVSAVRP